MVSETRMHDNLTLGTSHSIVEVISGQWKEPLPALPSTSSCAFWGEGPQLGRPGTFGAAETVDLFPNLSICLSCDFAESPHPGVIIYQSEATPGDLAGLSQRKTTQNDWKAFFKSKVL